MIWKKPDKWSKKFWLSVWPDEKISISAEDLVIKLLNNNVKMILIGGYAGIHHKLIFETERKDYDFIISLEENNLNKIYEIIFENYEINKKLFFSNLQNFIKLKTTSKKIDLIKRIFPCSHFHETWKDKNTPAPGFRIKNSKEQAFSSGFNYLNLIDNCEKITFLDHEIYVISKKDYINSQCWEAIEK